LAGIGLASGQARRSESTRKRFRFISALHRTTGCLESSLLEVSRVLPRGGSWKTDGWSVAKRQPLPADSGSRRVDATDLVAAASRQDEWSHRRMVKEPTECQGPYESKPVAQRHLASKPSQQERGRRMPRSASLRREAAAPRQTRRP